MAETLKLMVSRDAGSSYSQQATGELDVLLQQGKKLDDEMLRWVIEDDTGEQVKVCKIFHDILEFMECVSK